MGQKWPMVFKRSKNQFLNRGLLYMRDMRPSTCFCKYTGHKGNQKIFEKELVHIFFKRSYACVVGVFKFRDFSFWLTRASRWPTIRFGLNIPERVSVGCNADIFKSSNSSIMRRVTIHDFLSRSKRTPCQKPNIKLFLLFLALRPNCSRACFSAQFSYEHFYSYLVRVFFSDWFFAGVCKIFYALGSREHFQLEKIL